jgi:molecular chaperone GrpE (heat shock protein)
MSYVTPFQEPDHEPGVPADQPPVLQPSPAAPESLASPAEASVPSMVSEATCKEGAREVEGNDVSWKDALRQEFEDWLASLDELPPSEEIWDPTDSPDLYSFFEQLAAANAESRKANRRTAEAFSQWGDTLGRFDQELHWLHDQLNRLAEKPVKEDSLSRAHALVLVGWFDRLQRLARAFESPPPRSWWRYDATWRQAWDTQHQAFEILCDHFKGFLTQEGIMRLEVLHQPFDPASMTAVATEPDPSRPHHTVIEEISAGYLRQGELLVPAHVKVTINKTNLPDHE